MLLFFIFLLYWTAYSYMVCVLPDAPDLYNTFAIIRLFIKIKL